METPPISQLYYRYKRRDNDQILKFLNRVRFGEYTPTDNTLYLFDIRSLEQIYQSPRGRSLTFDTGIDKTVNSIDDLVPYKSIVYLVKSSSRFFLKPDVGEILDQIELNDFYDPSIKGLGFRHGHESLPGTEGEHFLMVATLFK